MLSDLQTRKLTHHFNLLDADRNGVVEENDYMLFTKKIAELRAIEADSDAYRELVTAEQALWEELRETADTDHDGRVSLDEMLGSWDHLITAIGEEKAKGASPTLERFNATVDSTFRLLDADSDGVASLQEYEAYCAAMGVGGDVRAMFERLDTDHDGAMSMEEIRRHVTDFFLGDDPQAPGNELYGPLRN